MATCAELQTMLAEAQAAYHQLAMGSKVQRVRYGEKDITYSPADMDKLAAYIAELTNEVAGACGSANRRRVIGIIPV